METPRRLLSIEVKAASRLRPEDARGLATLLEEYAALAHGGLLLTDRIGAGRRIIGPGGGARLT